MDVKLLLKEIEGLISSKEEGAAYVLGQFESLNTYYGLDSENNLVFAVESDNPKLHARRQKTRMLKFGFNLDCTVHINEVEMRKTLHILTCTSQNYHERLAFVRLTYAFLKTTNSDEPYALNDLFTALSHLFAKESLRSSIELQGFFAELYLIIYFHELNVKMYPYWQKEEKQKFDFSLSSHKKLEVKSSIREERIHHFQHEQLISDIYDIVVASTLLRKDDSGISILDAIEMVRDIAQDDYETLLYVENFINGTSTDQLDSLRYDEEYYIQNIRFVSAEHIPKFNGEQPEGVTKTEYDSNLTDIPSLSITEMLEWIGKR